MAPRFDKNYFKIYSEAKEAIICFTLSSIENNFEIELRDKLTKRVLYKNNLFVNKVIGYPLPIDSYFEFFNKKDKIEIEKFYKIKYPNIVLRLFNSKKWKEYKIMNNNKEQLKLFEIEISHDFPCLLIRNKLFNLNELRKIIQDISNELKINLIYNENLDNINDVIMSNKHYL